MNAGVISGFGAAVRDDLDRSRGFVQGASLHNLQQLVVMRNIAVVAQALTVLVVSRGMDIDLPLGAMGTIIALLALFNFATWRRLGLPRPVTELELMLQLLVDVAALSLLLALAGGATNPFVGMYLLPLTITAASLPWAYTWIVALATLGCYSLLVLFFRPLFGPGEEARYVHLLVSGMWVNYAITAGMIAHFVVQVSIGMRRSQQQTCVARERELCEEHLVRIGTLAAGAAHELARPLASMAVLISDLQAASKDRADMKGLADLAADQLKHCQTTLGELLSYGKHSFESELTVQSLDAYVRSCVDTLRARRRDVHVAIRVAGLGAAPSIGHDLALRQGLLNLLGNAADVSHDWIEVKLDWDAEHAHIEVCDRGPGFAPSVQQQIGRMFFTTKRDGLGNGLGLCLARTAVLRLGGSLDLFNLPDGGACARVTLPRADDAASQARPGRGGSLDAVGRASGGRA
ncbi:MAG: ATP-binding protein [Aquincola sp.]|nr:ATP-binding protein [Aquincola sp.]